MSSSNTKGSYYDLYRRNNTSGQSQSSQTPADTQTSTHDGTEQGYWKEYVEARHQVEENRRDQQKADQPYPDVPHSDPTESDTEANKGEGKKRLQARLYSKPKELDQRVSELGDVPHFEDTASDTGATIGEGEEDVPDIAHTKPKELRQRDSQLGGVSHTKGTTPRVATKRGKLIVHPKPRNPDHYTEGTTSSVAATKNDDTG
ncbi:hypothetical protein BU26DRAFT_503527 [Trematosphaeria pertusa]|uniref:Uncharacterized protein n=1 Tax=Trematosphaeria pertusa TaxID=390896 RepID=A0A6A6ILH5_9PLEO|nr:uncharacterized protein BU26DRAFT_503527 [Trematosphaeria pertusa]KAF2250918.1 hypothetical protein BU26DRAFT_503527 [Trematosphaeria pertusa]